MPVTRRQHNRIVARQAPTVIPTFSGVTGGGVALSETEAAGTLVLATDVPTGTAAVSAPPLAGDGAITLTSFQASSTSSSEVASQTATAQSASRSEPSIGTVVAACIGAFVGAGVIIFVLYWWIKRPAGQKSRARNAPGADQGHERNWNRLDEDGGGEDTWENKHKSQAEEDEKNFGGMFKKTNSMRTTRTARALEEHGFDLPPLEFSKYRPGLAEELAQPEKPFVHRQDSGISWDGETVGDDSFLSLRSVSGAISPTGVAKPTPPAMTSVIHRWESAEVLTVEEPQAAHTVDTKNPFSDYAAVEDRRKSGANPFFGAQEIGRSTSRGARSRSNSTAAATGRHSRSASRVSRISTVTRARTMSSAGASTSDTQTRVASAADPFSDEAAAGIPKLLKGHAQSDSTSSNPLGNEHAMKSLIAALNLTQEEVEERLRVASFHPSISTRYSGVSGMSGLTEDQDDAATIRDFPKPPFA
ncbi:hypothetical protein QCA50_006025 [Cerrena zonata]|uniref:Uncharacterized protein n=1 Tax=Cerrena zonata TaxID=2478898 RepID=A0AAW0GEK7_9APHY